MISLLQFMLSPPSKHDDNDGYEKCDEAKNTTDDGR